MKISKWAEYKKGQEVNGFLLASDAQPPKDNNGHWRALFFCGCGEVFETNFSNIMRSSAAGCRKCANEASASAKRIYDVRDRGLYCLWKGMNYRCKKPVFKGYCGRGIKVCEEWDDTSKDGFHNFYRDMAPRPSKLHSLDRIDNDKGYYKDNCRWATQKQQCNNMRSNHRVTYKQCEYTIQELADKYNIKSNTLLYRLRRGWEIDEAVIGKRDHLWVRPYKNVLTDDEFDTLLMLYYEEGVTITYLSAMFGVDNGNLSRVFRKEEVLQYYKGFHDAI